MLRFGGESGGAADVECAANVVEVEDYRAIKQTAQRDVDTLLDAHRRRD